MSTYKGTKNTVIIIGNLTADPELRQTGSGQMVANIRVASNRGWKDATGQLQEETEFHQIVLWGRLAEIASQYFAKGRKVYIEGRLRTRNWEGQDGVKRYTTEVVAEDIMILSPKGNNDSAGGHSFMPNKEKQGQKESPAIETFEDDNVSSNLPADDEIKLEDLPF